MQEGASPVSSSLSAQILEEALHDVLTRATGSPGSAEYVPTLQLTAQVAAALQQLQLSGAAEAGSAPPSGSCDDADPAAGLAGTAAGPLGVSPHELLAEALPSEPRRQQALAWALPALQAELRRRCRLVAAASGYRTDDYAGLPDHLAQLRAAAAGSQAAQAEAWRGALTRAEQVAAALAKVARLYCDLLSKHKLQGQKAADEAHAAHLRSQVAWLVEKIRLVELQLQDSTYSPEAVPVLRLVAEEVATTVGAATAQLQQAAMRLQQYQALGPGFEALAREHGAVAQALEEAQYELREVEQFRQLAAVTG